MFRACGANGVFCHLVISISFESVVRPRSLSTLVDVTSIVSLSRSNLSSLSVAVSPLSNQIGEFRCRFCNCPYSSTSHLKRHLTRGCFMDPSFSIEARRNMNKIKSRNHVCPKCSQGYKNKRTLNTHLRSVCGHEPKFQCPYCGLKSKHPPNIYTHIRRRHKGEDLYLIIEQENAK